MVRGARGADREFELKKVELLEFEACDPRRYGYTYCGIDPCTLLDSEEELEDMMM